MCCSSLANGDTGSLTRGTTDSCSMQTESRTMISTLEMSLSCLSQRLEEVGQKTQGCFEVFLTNESASELNSRCIRTHVLDVSTASVDGLSVFRRAVIRLFGLREGLLGLPCMGKDQDACLGFPIACSTALTACENASAALAPGPRSGQQRRASQNIIQTDFFG